MDPDDPHLLTWRNKSTLTLRDFVGYDGERGVARIMQPPNAKDWRWSVYAIIPGRPGATHGYEADPKEARRKAEAIWLRAKSEGVPMGAHIKL
jgi:hypothetical protein